jgi:hypothetical protein
MTTPRTRLVPSAYVNEMEALLQQELEEAPDGWVAATLATRLAARLREEDPDLLRGWLDMQAENLIRDNLVRRSNAQRTRARKRSTAIAFRESATLATRTGDYSELIGMFSAVHTVSNNNVRRAARDMTGNDHRYVAARYRSTANEYLMLAAFHNAVARKVGDMRTSEVFTEEEYEMMYRSIVRTAA